MNITPDEVTGEGRGELRPFLLQPPVARPEASGTQGRPVGRSGETKETAHPGYIRNVEWANSVARGWNSGCGMASVPVHFQ